VELRVSHHRVRGLGTRSRTRQNKPTSTPGSIVVERELGPPGRKTGDTCPTAVSAGSGWFPTQRCLLASDGSFESDRASVVPQDGYDLRLAATSDSRWTHPGRLTVASGAGTRRRANEAQASHAHRSRDRLTVATGAGARRRAKEAPVPVR
jgi:hypothetical protein